MCSGWGDPHYITFDGTYYTFLDSCTYVLVQQVVPVYGHFRVLIDNYLCGAESRVSCPQSIIIEYRGDRVVLTRKPVLGVMTNEVGDPRAVPCGPGRLGDLPYSASSFTLCRSSSTTEWSGPASRKMA